MAAAILVSPAIAANNKNNCPSQDLLLQFGNVYVPYDAPQRKENNATIYYDFYDSVNDMHYAYYNSETGEHFAMSGPKCDLVTEVNGAARKAKTIAHSYSFAGRYTISGKDNGITFELPATTVYLSGEADTENISSGMTTSDNYINGYHYTIAIRQNVVLFPQTKTVSGIAGNSISSNFSSKASRYYLEVTPVDRLEDGEWLVGNGTIYYYA